MRLQIAALILSTFLLLGSAAESKVSAEVSKTESHYVTIPILYVTDRAATRKGYGPQRKLESLDSIDDLHYGWLNYSLQTHEEISSQQKQLGWHEEQKCPRHLLSTAPLLDVKGNHDFGQVVIDTAKKAGTDDVFVMVHGFNTPFANAAKGAALLAYHVQRPVILYSWPSKGKIGQYDVDLGNNEWSQEHFDQLLEELNHVKDISGIKLTLLAHSMGNRLAVRSAPVLKGKHLFKQMFLVDPDFDAETFVHYLVRYARKQDETAAAAAEIAVAASAAEKPGSAAEKTEPTAKPEPSEAGQKSENVEPTKVRILFSHKDHALPLSEFLFGGYTRLGQAADTLLSVVVAPYSLPDKISGALNSTGTTDATTTNDVKKPDWLVNFEWIDFTVLDHGIVGHTIPYELIANLWSTNEAGEGMKLVHSDNGSPNRLASLFFHMFGEKDHISAKIDSSERVVLTTKEKKSLTDR